MNYYWFPLVIGLICVAMIGHELLTGVAGSKSLVVKKSEYPKTFWAIVASQVVGTALLASQVLYGLWTGRF